MAAGNAPRFPSRFQIMNLKPAEKAYLKDLGLEIKKHRKLKKRTLRDMKKNGVVNTAYLSEIENGKKNPSLVVLHRIAKSLGIDIRALLPPWKF